MSKYTVGIPEKLLPNLDKAVATRGSLATRSKYILEAVNEAIFRDLAKAKNPKPK